MFLEHFGLSIQPFSVSADPRFLYFGDVHREAVSAVYLSIVDGGGVSVLLAGPGMGKTTLLRYLLTRLDGRAAVAFFPHPYRDRRDLMNEVVSKVGLSETAGGEFEQMSRLQRRLAELKSRGYRLVLLFDEVQSLSSEALEQVRLLSNLRSTNQNLLDIVLAGQSEFEEMLDDPAREALRQRIHTIAKVEALSPDDTARYVRHRLKVAGSQTTVFSDAALALVAEVTKGVPRTINQLCHKALAVAWSEDLIQVEEPAVREAAQELELFRPPPRPAVPADAGRTETPVAASAAPSVSTGAGVERR